MIENETTTNHAINPTINHMLLATEVRYERAAQIEACQKVFIASLPLAYVYVFKLDGKKFKGKHRRYKY